MVPIKQKRAHRGNYGSSRSVKDIEYIVIHYTGNDGDTDENNGIYFANNDVDVSAHYFVDDDSITQSVPDDYVAWHCGTKGKYCQNRNSIGIEICDDVKNGTIYPSAKTIQNALDLTASLMAKYNIPASKVIRHYDATGKICPAYWSGSAVKDALWKSEFWSKLPGATPSPTTTTVKQYYRVQVGAFSKRSGAEALKKELESKGYSAIIKYN